LPTDQSTAPLLNALADYRAKNRYGFTPPGPLVVSPSPYGTCADTAEACHRHGVIQPRSWAALA
jgi:hypothetical protein